MNHWKLGVVVIVGMALTLLAQTTQPAPKSSGDVMKSLEDKMEPNPVVEPTHRSPTGRPVMDPNVLGNAPGIAPAKLRHEGDFVVNRLGRLTRATGGTQFMFTFESDSKTAPEPPVILLPCRMLENMEELVQEHGDNIVFVLSGQVTTYHGANYLLPTLMKLAVDKGNLQK